MGKSQRRKGVAQEYVLRNLLRQQGWQADRVPCSGAAQGFKGDIAAVHPKYGRKVFELKSRKDSFKKVYELYDACVKHGQDDLIAVAIPGAETLCLNISTSLEAVLGPADYHTGLRNHPLYEKYKRTWGKIANMEKWLGEAEILAIKDDRRPHIFLRWL
jgi:Holliday junction resolvase